MIRIAATFLLLLTFATTPLASKAKSDNGKELLFQLEAKVAADGKHSCRA
jgi:hypothetical protein